MRKCIFIYRWLPLLIAFSSCRKVIDIDLNSASPQLVVEGSITDQPVPYTVKLTRTINFSETNTFPAVTGAVVSLSDNIGNSETLIETTPGIYTGNQLEGSPGRTYTLAIISNGKNYLASSTMPYPVEIDTLTVQKTFFGNNKIVITQFQDTVGIKNYYRFIEIVNGVPEKSIFTMDDNLEDGRKISYGLFSREDSLVKGDSVIVLLQSIDKNVYTYFNNLDELSNGGGQSSSPANPTSNILNGALGYFSAYSVRMKNIVIR
jgi:Domain of unknown function (DUF4249)